MIDNPIFSGIAVFFTILFLLNLRSFMKMLPSLISCIWRWKSNVDLEDSLQLSRSRDLIAGILFVPNCMLACSYSLYSPEFLNQFPTIIRFGILTGIMLVYVLLRSFLNWQLEMHDYSSRPFTAANKSFYNFTIVLFSVVFIAGAILKAWTGDVEVTRTFLLWAIAVIYAIYVFRRAQIFASVCNPFTTFLYLCGLEILPTGALVLSAMLT